MIELRKLIPTVDDFLRLREISGLSARSREGAERGLPNSLFAVTLFDGGKAIGMGRIIGDGGLNFEIVDIAVDPQWQGRGYGRQIMERLMQWLSENAPPRAYVSLVGDVPELYEKFGFRKVRPASEGMALVMPEK